MIVSRIVGRTGPSGRNLSSVKRLAALAFVAIALPAFCDTVTPGVVTNILAFTPDHAGFRVLWSYFDERTDPGPSIRSMRLFPSGAPDPGSAREVMRIDAGSTVAIGSTDAATFIAWTDRLNFLHFAALAADGTLAPGDTILGFPAYEGRLSCNARRCAATWSTTPFASAGRPYFAQFFDANGARSGGAVRLPTTFELNAIVVDDSGLFLLHDHNRAARIDNAGRTRFDVEFEPTGAAYGLMADFDGQANAVAWILPDYPWLPMPNIELRTIGTDGTMSPIREILPIDRQHQFRGFKLIWGGTQHLFAVAHGVYDPRYGAPVDLDVLRLDPSLNVIGKTTLFSTDKSYFFVGNAGWNGSRFAVGWTESRDGTFYRPLGSRTAFVDLEGHAGTFEWIDQFVPPPATPPPPSRRRGAAH